MQPEKRCPATTWSCFNASLQRTKCFYLGGLQRICSPSLPPSLFLDLAAIMHLGLISWAETITRLRLSARESKNVDFSFLDTKGLEYEFTESTYSICHINFRTFCLPMASSMWCVRKIMRYSEKITGHDNRWMCLFLSFGQTKSVPRVIAHVHLFPGTLCPCGFSWFTHTCPQVPAWMFPPQTGLPWPPIYMIPSHPASHHVILLFSF